MIRKVNLGHDTQYLSTFDKDRAVIQATGQADGRTDGNEHPGRESGAGYIFYCLLGSIEQALLTEKVCTGIACYAQFGENHYGSLVLRGFFRKTDDLCSIAHGIGQIHPRRGSRYADITIIFLAHGGRVNFLKLTNLIIFALYIIILRNERR